MLREIRVFMMIVCVSLLTACAALPNKTTEAVAASTPSLRLVYEDRHTLLYVRPGFDVSAVRKVAVGDVKVEESPRLDAVEKSEQETLARDLQTSLSAAFHAGNSASDLYLDVSLSDIEPVSPLLNVVTTVLLVAPLDTGALTLDSQYRDASGTVEVRRVERITGSIFNVMASFSHYGQHRVALDEYVQRCSAVQACLNKPEQ